MVVIFLAQKFGDFFFSVNSTTFVNILENFGGQNLLLKLKIFFIKLNFRKKKLVVSTRIFLIC